MKDSRQAIVAVVEAHAREVIADLPTILDPSRRLSDYGATSLDGVVILMSAIAELGVDVTPQELSGVQTIDDLVTLIASK